MGVGRIFVKNSVFLVVLKLGCLLVICTSINGQVWYQKNNRTICIPSIVPPATETMPCVSQVLTDD